MCLCKTIFIPKDLLISEEMSERMFLGKRTNLFSFTKYRKQVEKVMKSLQQYYRIVKDYVPLHVRAHTSTASQSLASTRIEVCVCVCGRVLCALNLFLQCLINLSFFYYYTFPVFPCSMQ